MTQDDEDVRTVYIGNLPFSTSELEVRTLFEVYGKIIKMKTLNQTNSRQFHGVMFVVMETKEQADKAVEGLNQTIFGNRKLKVSIAVRKAPEKDFKDDRPPFDSKPRPPRPYGRDSRPDYPEDRYDLRKPASYRPEPRDPYPRYEHSSSGRVDRREPRDPPPYAPRSERERYDSYYPSRSYPAERYDTPPKYGRQYEERYEPPPPPPRETGYYSYPRSEQYYDRPSSYAAPSDDYPSQTSYKYSDYPAPPSYKSSEYKPPSPTRSEYPTQPRSEYSSQSRSEYAAPTRSEYPTQSSRTEYSSKSRSEYAPPARSDYPAQTAREYPSQSSRTEYTPQSISDYTPSSRSEYSAQTRTDYNPYPSPPHDKRSASYADRTPREEEKKSTEQTADYRYTDYNSTTYKKDYR